MKARDLRRLGIVGLYVTAAGALALAPALMPAGYSWVEHTTSESAAQGVDGAWLARAGFLLFGFGVLATAVTTRKWSIAARVAHATFAICMIAAAAFSSRPADVNAPYVASEDTLHSVVASLMGIAFAVGVVLVAARRARGSWFYMLLDAAAIIASVAIPLAMATWDDRAGLAQRVMFAIAFAWYLAATLSRQPGQQLGLEHGLRSDQTAATASPPTGRSRPPAAPVADAPPRARASG